ncbi:MAG: hypothetical protein NVS2B7_17790 [Herpetosiphon sp.]
MDASFFRTPALRAAVVFVATVLLSLVACLHALSIDFPIGSSFDRPYVAGFNREPEYVAGRTRPFRWAFKDALLRVPGVGQAVYEVRLEVIAAAGPATVSRWFVGNTPLVTLPIQRGGREYTLLAPTRSDDLALRMVSTTVSAGNDRRPLAFAVDRWAVRSVSMPGPPWRYIGGYGLLVTLAYGLLGLWRMPSRPALGLGLLGAVAVAVVLGVWRTALTTALGPWLGLVVAAYPLSWLLLAGLRGLGELLQPGARWPRHGVAGLIVVAWLVRCFGLLHPQAIFSDTLLHAHNLQGLAWGRVFFTEDLPTRAGGGPAPYPPGGYLVQLPGMLGFDAVVLTMAGAALADSLVIGAFGMLGLVGGLPAAAVLFAGILYVVAPPALLSLSIGEMANVVGQALVLPVMVALLSWRRNAVTTAACIGWATVALLGHFGIFLSLVAFLGVYCAGLLLVRTAKSGRLAAGMLLAMGLAIGLYYQVWSTIILHRPAAPPATNSAWDRISTQLAGLGGMRDVGYVLTIIGLVGLGLLWRERRMLGWLAGAWWIAGVASLAPLLFSQQALRWQLWLVAVAALCGGVTLDTLWRWNRAGRVMAVGVLLLVVGPGVWRWIGQIATGYH